MAPTGSPDRNMILAGGQNPALAYFAVANTALPSDADTALASAFNSPGYVSTDGLTIAVEESTTGIPAYGVSGNVRVLTTENTTTFACNFLETNPISVAIYERKGLLSLTVDDADGSFAVSAGKAEGNPVMVGVFELVDRHNLVRYVCPNLEVTGRGNEQWQNGNAVIRPVTMTAYPDDAGYSVYKYFIMNALRDTPLTVAFHDGLDPNEPAAYGVRAKQMKAAAKAESKSNSEKAEG